MIDTQIDNYRIIEKIGDGGMGSVYKAVDVMLEREVALKFLRPELAQQPDLVERFRAEAIVLAKLIAPEHRLAVRPAPPRRRLLHGDGVRAGRHARGRARARTHAVRIARPATSPATCSTRSTTRTGAASSTATSRPPTSSCRPTAACKVMDFGIARVLGTERRTRVGLRRRHDRLHGPRADPGAGGRRAHRHLRARRRALRDAHRPGAVPGRDRVRGDAGADPADARAAPRVRGRCRSRSRTPSCGRWPSSRTIASRRRPSSTWRCRRRCDRARCIPATTAPIARRRGTRPASSSRTRTWCAAALPPSGTAPSYPLPPSGSYAFQPTGAGAAGVRETRDAASVAAGHHRRRLESASSRPTRRPRR